MFINDKVKIKEGPYELANQRAEWLCNNSSF